MCFNEKLLNNSNVILSSKAVSFNDGLKDDSCPTLDGKIVCFFFPVGNCVFYLGNPSKISSC